MALTVSRRTIGIALGVVVVLVIITMVVVRMRSKSKYAYPDAAAAAKTTSVVQSAASGGAGIVTITTNAAHGYAAGDVVLYSTTPFTVLTSPSPTSTAFSIATASAAATFTAGSTFIPAYKTLTDALEVCNIANALNPNASTFTTCIETQTTTYYNSMCPYLSTDPSAANGAPAAYVTAKTTLTNETASTSATSIGSAYTGLKNSASTAMTPVVNAARKADITGATRKYMATVCPNYYVTATGTATPSNYTTWAVYATASAAGASTYYFQTDRVKFTTAAEKTSVLSKITEWAKYAAQNPTNTGGPTAPLVSGCNLYNAMSADGVTPNWKLAQQYGPGTVISGVTLPWNTTESTCTAAVTAAGLILN